MTYDEKRNLKIGDKVRITNINGIAGGERHFHQDSVTKVIGFSDMGNPYLRSTKTNSFGEFGHLVITPDEFDYIKLVSTKTEEANAMKITRENVHQVKVGDKVRIVDVDSILFGRRHFENGDITEVTKVNVYADSLRVRSVNHPDGEGSGNGSEGFQILSDELRAVEKVGKAKKPAKKTVNNLEVGDKVRVLNAKAIAGGTRHFNDGDITTVQSFNSSGDPRLATVKDEGLRDALVIYSTELRYIELVEDSDVETSAVDARLVEIVEQMEALVAEAKALANKKAESSAFDKAVTLAKKIITDEEAARTIFKLVYHVNEDKGVVVARLVRKSNGEEVRKGMARLSPGDTFNEEIGKAIAIKRALKERVPAELTRKDS